MKFEIGQIIFVLLNKKMAIVPVQVIEEACRKTIDGETVTYKVKMGKEEPKIYDLSQIDGKIYTDIEKLKENLFENALKSIEKMCENTKIKSRDWFGNSKVLTPASIPPDRHSDADDGTIMIELPDGTSARVKMTGNTQA